MVYAIMAALVVIVVAGVALFVFFRARNIKPGSSVPKSVTSIGSATPFQTRTGSSSVGTSSPMGAATGGVRERLKSRFMAIGVLIAAVFGSLTAKLWSMQVLSNKQYVEAANENQYTTIKTPAARGRIFDTQGIVMVDHRRSGRCRCS